VTEYLESRPEFKAIFKDKRAGTVVAKRSIMPCKKQGDHFNCGPCVAYVCFSDLSKYWLCSQFIFHSYSSVFVSCWVFPTWTLRSVQPFLYRVFERLYEHIRSSLFCDIKRRAYATRSIFDILECLNCVFWCDDMMSHFRSCELCILMWWYDVTF